ncbi:MAG: hypothetical protein ABIH41_01150 [Nanoarchaeota archaeon]
MYHVHLSSKANKYMQKLEPKARAHIESVLKRLATNPVPSSSRFIFRDETGDKVFRIRAGDQRALYKILERDKIVLVAKIDKRPRVYHR